MFENINCSGTFVKLIEQVKNEIIYTECDENGNILSNDVKNQSAMDWRKFYQIYKKISEK